MKAVCACVAFQNCHVEAAIARLAGSGKTLDEGARPPLSAENSR
jgi:hypothetical protein